jgi:hypothetical protein
MAVASTVAIVGAAVGVAAAVASGAQAGAAAAKSKKAQREAEGQAKKKLEEAKKEIQRMPMQELSLDLQGFKAEQEASQVAAAQSIQAAQQGEGRGLAAAVGRTQMADIAQQRAARLDKATELQALEMTKAKERQEASDKLAGLSLAEAQGAQEAAAQEEMMAQQYTQQAIGSGVEAVKGAANLYSAVQGPYDPTSGTQLSSQGTQESLISDMQYEGSWYGDKYGDASAVTGDSFQMGGVNYSLGNTTPTTPTSSSAPYKDPITGKWMDPVTGLPLGYGKR